MTAAHGVLVGGARRRALTSRVSTGHTVMVLAGLLGALLTLNVLRTADNTTPVYVAAREISPGTVIDTRALRIVRIHADGRVLASLFGADSIDDLRGKVAVARVAAGALVTHDDVRPLAAGVAPRAMSFPIPISRAVGGALVSGDHVDVLAVGRNTGRSVYVATDVSVLEFSGRRSSALQGSEDASVTLAVDPDAAARIASALETGSVTLVRVTGAAPLPARP